jgi:hypothetical protein
MINSQKLIEAEHVACRREEKNTYRVLVGKPEVNRPLENLDVDGRIILKWLSEK